MPNDAPGRAGVQGMSAAYENQALVHAVHKDDCKIEVFTSVL